MPALVKILVVFAALLVLARASVPLGAALLLGGLALELWAGVTPQATAVELLRACAASDLWLMLAVTFLIIELGRFVSEERNAARINAAVRRWGGRHADAFAVAMPPAIIGLIPMPAGAAFSAPLVAGSSIDGDTPEWKSAVNYWFRHVWEYWWPLYPGVIVAMSVFEMRAGPFIAAQLPFSIVAIGAGYLFLVRPHVKPGRGGGDGGDGKAPTVVMAAVLAVIVALLALPPLFARVWPAMGAEVQKLLALLAGLLLAHALILGERRATEGSWPTLRSLLAPLASRHTMNVLFSLGGVLVFKSLMEASGLLPDAGRELLSAGIPAEVAVVVLPFFAGFVTGVAVGFAGVAFPLVVGLMHTPGAGMTPLSTLVLAYGAGYMGMMLSPVHLCLLVTRDYFRSHLRGIYAEIAPCVVTVSAYTGIAWSLLRWVRL